MEKPYVVVYRGRKKLVYGPFRDEESAKKASYFNQPVSVSDAHRFEQFPFGVQWYEDDELAYLTRYPEEHGYSVLERRPARMSVHPSWRALFATYRPDAKLRDELDDWWTGKMLGRW